jgi:peptidyl-prolyl cis-trans isomerase C
MRTLRKEDHNMTLKTASRPIGAYRAAAIAGAIILAISTQSWAQTAATVNGAKISNDVFNMYLESRIQKPAEQASAEERENILTELKDIYLLTTQTRAKALAKDAQIKAQVELQTRGILAQAVAADFLATNGATDDEIKAAYEQQLELSPPLEFKARHILVETQGEAQSLIAQLDGGTDFAELAKEKSTGPSGPNGGDLGWFSPNQMVPPFSQAVSKLENGAFTKEPVQTQFGWHVILREDSRDTAPPTLESVRDVIKQRVEQDKLRKYVEDLRATLSK